jgi:hypothetical protein
MIYASQTHEINKIQQYYILITAWTLPKDFRVKFAAPFGGFLIKKEIYADLQEENIPVKNFSGFGLVSQ